MTRTPSLVLLVMFANLLVANLIRQPHGGNNPEAQSCAFENNAQSNGHGLGMDSQPTFEAPSSWSSTSGSWRWAVYFQNSSFCYPFSPPSTPGYQFINHTTWDKPTGCYNYTDMNVAWAFPGDCVLSFFKDDSCEKLVDDEYARFGPTPPETDPDYHCCSCITLYSGTHPHPSPYQNGSWTLECPDV